MSKEAWDYIWASVELKTHVTGEVPSVQSVFEEAMRVYNPGLLIDLEGSIKGNPDDLMMGQVLQLERYLDMFGEIASGDSLYDRVRSVVVHYATQMGRWHKRKGEGRIECRSRSVL
jgi:hypothetical protein